jgi:hypothetical protein
MAAATPGEDPAGPLGRDTLEPYHEDPEPPDRESDARPSCSCSMQTASAWLSSVGPWRSSTVGSGRQREALGRPVPSNDLWIAASATANGLSLVTLNRRHFKPLTLHGLRLL